MVFAHDTERALAGVVALVNTLGRDGDTLADRAALDDFVRSWEWSGERRRDDAELQAVRRLRPRLREAWSGDEDRVVAVVNDLLARNKALPQLVRHDGYAYHLHATSPDAPLASRMAVEAAMALVDVIRQGELDRLRVCGAHDCADVLVDLSKNRSRRFCDTSCANRTHVGAFRARRSAHAGP
jgi:predicted RNA-binding Zn ribbon-like protein